MHVVIIGGGISGASLALAISALSQKKIKVALIEENLLYPNISDFSFDARTIALSYGTCCYFNQIGIWHGLRQYATPITHIHVSEHGHAGVVNIYAKDYSLPALGYVIELHNIKNYLFKLLKQMPNVTVYCPNKVISIEWTIDFVSVKLLTGKILTGKLLVAADGSNSIISKTNKIEWQQDLYQQCAITANIVTSKKSCGKAFERFTRYGPLAMLPISKGRSSLVWCHSLKNQQYIMQLSNDQFMAELQKFFGWRLGEIKEVSKRSSFPLLLLQAKRIINHRLVLIGNAAQTLHPIAGQGFNLTMRDLIILANVINKVYNCASDIGAYSVLMQYQIYRLNDRYRTIKLTDNLVHLFSNNHLIFAIIRNLGLMAMDTLPIIREILVRQAMGLLI